MGAIACGVDASVGMLEVARGKAPGAELKEGLFAKIPYSDNTFDIVTSKWAVETHESIEAVYREVRRVLKAGGFLLMVNNHPMRQFLEKKTKPRNYFTQERVEFPIFDGKLVVVEPSHTFEEYLCKYFLENFTIEAFEERFTQEAVKVDNDTYAGSFLLKAHVKKNYGEIERVQPYVTLNNGVKFPMFGLGTCYLTDAEHIRISVTECGYRMLDCASCYKNEEVVGVAINGMLNGKNPIKREELYVVSKVWQDEGEDCESACRRSLANLQVDYLDMYLVHWPIALREIQPE